MKVSEALIKAAALREGNTFDDSMFVLLSRLDGQIKLEVLDKYTTEVIYDSDYTLDTELLVPEPYTDLYIYYLVSQIDLYNNEINRFNNSVALYNDAYSKFKNYYNSNNKRKKYSNITFGIAKSTTDDPLS